MKANTNWQKCSQKQTNKVKVPLWPKRPQWMRGWVRRNLLEFNRVRCRPWHHLWSHPVAERWWAEFQPCCNLGVMAGAKLNISPYVKCSSCRANLILCWELYWEEQDQQVEGSYPLLLGTGELAPGTVVQFWVPPPRTTSKKDVEKSGEGPAAGYRGREHVACEDRLVELAVYSLARRRLGQGLIVAYNCIKGNCKDDKAMFFPDSRSWPINGQ